MKIKLISDNELMHYGIQKQKWGNRRYQKDNGSYTEEGLQRRNLKKMGKLQYNLMEARLISEKIKFLENAYKMNDATFKKAKERIDTYEKYLNSSYKKSLLEKTFDKTVEGVVKGTAKALSKGFLEFMGVSDKPISKKFKKREDDKRKKDDN